MISSGATGETTGVARRLAAARRRLL